MVTGHRFISGTLEARKKMDRDFFFEPRPEQQLFDDHDPPWVPVDLKIELPLLPCSYS